MARGERLERNAASSEAAIERPSSRAATAFVPRLGKRDALDASSSLLCASSPSCSRLVLLSMLTRGLDRAAELEQPDELAEFERPELAEQLAGRQQKLQRQIRTSTGELVASQFAGASNAKRLAFTPRIG